ncbi:MORC family CW-type zinc finger protein 4-like isoform X2 [Ananas comosus]|nr:MORC family CW-type zinc finger protein 4-like isoform X2 [Ananas comosus]
MSRMLNLNEPPLSEDGPMRYILLQKDNKPICRTKSFNLPFDVPLTWSITKFRPSEILSNGRFPNFRLYPDPENSHQSYEWGAFLNFLWKHQRAGLVSSEYCRFYILAPDEFPEFSHAIILYQTEKPGLVCNQQNTGTSGQLHNDRRICTRNFIQTSSRKEQIRHADRSPIKLPSPPEVVMHRRDSRHHLGEEIVDNGFLNMSRIGDVPYSMNVLHQAPRKPSPCESVEDAPSTSHPKSVKRADVVNRNFVKTDPSYLRTLSQTHAGWIFGAIAELVDNSRDADASRLDISIESLYSKKEGKRVPVLSVIDDGHGMSHTEIMRMLSFGHKQPNEDEQDRIGRFGIGFKTGAMKLGRDALVLTQTSNSRSVALLSQSYNESKENLEIPVITYSKQCQFMEVDLSVQSEVSTEISLKAIKEFSPFNEYFIGEKLGLFGEMGTGTQIYIWNLDKWGSDYSLEWSQNTSASGDILIRSRRVRSRPGQVSQKVPLDYSLRLYLEVIFLDPRMKIYVQGSLVKCQPLAKSLNKTAIISGDVMGKAIQLTLGRSNIEWQRMNCGIFLYWHGRLIEAYKRVGGQIHNADMGRGVIGVIDVTNLMDDENGNVWVLNSKQGFQDCEAYAELEKWLGRVADEYWDKHYEPLGLKKGNERYMPDHEWVQCSKCRKWRILTKSFNSDNLPLEWFCYMSPFNGKCETPEQQMGHGIITVSAKRSGYTEQTATQQEVILKNAQKKKRSCAVMVADREKQSASTTKFNEISDDELGEDASQADDEIQRPPLKRLRRGPARSCKKS